MESNRFLLAGGTGFLGSIIRDTLARDHQVVTLGRSAQNNIVVNLASNVPPLSGYFDVIVHNAGKAHVVPKTAEERQAFFDVNVRGTENLLSALEKLKRKPGAFVFISTIAVYGLTRGEGIAEGHSLNARDPYGKTKIEAEKRVADWCSRRGVPLTILRLPLIVGKNPPGNLAAMIDGMRKGVYVSIAGGGARKSMVLGEDVASFIPVAARYPGTYNLTDGHHPSFRELEWVIAKQTGGRMPVNIPHWIAKLMGLGGDVVDNIFPGKSPVTSNRIEKLVATLTFDDSRARSIGWKPRQVLTHFVIK